MLLAGLPVAILILHFGLKRLFPGDHYFRFVALACLAFGWVVLWFYSQGWNTVPESRRYALEMEMFLLVLLFEVFRISMRAPIVPMRYFAIYGALAIFLSGWGQVRKFSTQGFEDRQPSPKENFIEYRMAEKLASLHPQGRVFASGGLRFRLNSWFPIAQVGGGFESGLRNRTPLELSYQIRTGAEGERGIRQLETLGVQYVAIHGPKSREHYRDFKNPQKFDGLLEQVWREEDDAIYRVPYSSLATIQNLTVTWRGASDIHIQGAIPATEVVSLRVNYDSDWRATQDGRPLVIERDPIGYMTLRPAPSPAAHIELNYRGSSEQRIMAALSALVWLGSIWATVFRS